MKRSTFLLSALISGATFFTSCTKERLTGDGAIATEVRNLSQFSMVDLSGLRKAEIIRSNKSMVEVTGYENLIPVFECHVNNGRLSFKYPNFSKVTNDNISLKIYTNAINCVNMSGKTEVLVGDGFSDKSFKANLSGSSTLRFGEGKFEFLEIYSSGSSEVYARNFESKNAKVVISGQSFIEVNASSELSVDISGEGEVHYWGDPKVNSKISGNGKTIKH